MKFALLATLATVATATSFQASLHDALNNDEVKGMSNKNLQHELREAATPAEQSSFLQKSEDSKKNEFVKKAVKKINAMIEPIDAELEKVGTDCEARHTQLNADIEATSRSKSQEEAKIMLSQAAAAEAQTTLATTQAERDTLEQEMQEEKTSRGIRKTDDQAAVEGLEADEKVCQMIVDQGECAKKFLMLSECQRLEGLTESKSVRTHKPHAHTEVEESSDASQETSFIQLSVADSQSEWANLHKLKSPKSQVLLQDALKTLYHSSPATNSTTPLPNPNAGQGSGCVMRKEPNCHEFNSFIRGMLGGVQEDLRQARALLAQNQEADRKYFDETNSQLGIYASTLGNANERLGKAEADVKEASESAESLSLVVDTTTAELNKDKKGCDEALSQLKSDKCGLLRARGEMERIAKAITPRVDCQQGDWEPQGGCSKTCGGGKQRKKRETTVNPVGDGVPCGPELMEEDCNMQECPIDCVLSPWSAWSKCSAECGGGLEESTRTIERYPKNGGENCDATITTQACHTHACNADCELAVQTTEWTPCDRLCATGDLIPVKRADPTVLSPERGTGTCSEEKWDQNTQFQECNNVPCSSVINENTVCNDKMDVVFLLDATWSWNKGGKTEFDDEKDALKNVVDRMGEDTNVGVVSYGGWPKPKWQDLTKNADGQPAMIAKKGAKDAISGAEFLDGVTWLDAALERAQEMFTNSGRAGADVGKFIVAPLDHLPRRRGEGGNLEKQMKILDDKQIKVIFVPMGRAWRREKKALGRKKGPRNWERFSFSKLAPEGKMDESVLMLPAPEAGKSRKIDEIIIDVLPDMCYNLVDKTTLIQTGSATSFFQSQASKLFGF
jgi:hypothetical protein